ncbi:hypothetical protein ACFL4T_04865 [candidate division KSB1 bacterium]
MELKRTIFLIMFFASIMVINCEKSTVSAQNQNDFPELTGEYLGQTPPGRMPEMFAPGIISVEANFEHSAAVFSPDKKEVFWCTNVGMYTDNRIIGNLRLYTMKIVNGKWTAPEPASFVKDFCAERPVFSPDGSKLYFECFSDLYTESDTDIFVVERTESGWSELKPVSSRINSSNWERLQCVSSDGSMYFTRNLMMNGEAVYVSRMVNGEFTEPEKLGEEFNSDDHELAIVFGPGDEYFLIDQMNDGRQDELVISYKRPDGTWTDKIKISPPNHCGGFLSVSPDGKYLFFLGDGIFWMSTSFVEDLKPVELK